MKARPGLEARPSKTAADPSTAQRSCISPESFKARCLTAAEPLPGELRTAEQHRATGKTMLRKRPKTQLGKWQSDSVSPEHRKPQSEPKTRRTGICARFKRNRFPTAGHPTGNLLIVGPIPKPSTPKLQNSKPQIFEPIFIPITDGPCDAGLHDVLVDPGCHGQGSTKAQRQQQSRHLNRFWRLVRWLVRSWLCSNSGQ